MKEDIVYIFVETYFIEYHAGKWLSEKTTKHNHKVCRKPTDHRGVYIFSTNISNKGK